MFKSAEIGSRIDKERWKRDAPTLRERLVKAQKALAGSNRSVVILVSGVEGAGKAQLVDLLLEWMDARGIQVHAYSEPTKEEAGRPRFWRYWRDLPAKGRLAVFLGSWYTEPIVQRAYKRLASEEFESEIARVAEFEKMLSHEGVVLVKLWLHLSKKDQRRRLTELEGDPDTRWRVTDRDWKFFERYDRFREASEAALLKTHTDESPWHVIEASDPRYRNLAAVRRVLEALEAAARAPAPEPGTPDHPKPARGNRLLDLDLTQSLPEEEYEQKLEKYQGRLNRLTRKLYEKKRELVLVFEGADAAGKGGAIRRLTRAMDARNYRVISTAAPSDEERARPYLWRFWRELPGPGRATIYDRSWYGRVLVERLEGFCSKADWRRAYSEINAFERQLADSGAVVVKFYLSISPEEQLKRFEDRQTTPYKQYKIGEEDWRNRKKWDGYLAAAGEMIARTDFDWAPWILVEAEDKNWARVKVLKSVCRILDEALS